MSTLSTPKKGHALNLNDLNNLITTNHPLDPEEIRAMRERWSLTQEGFAVMVAGGLNTVQSWEAPVDRANSRRPNKSVSLLLSTIDFLIMEEAGVEDVFG